MCTFPNYNFAHILNQKTSLGYINWLGTLQTYFICPYFLSEFEWTQILSLNSQNIHKRDVPVKIHGELDVSEGMEMALWWILMARQWIVAHAVLLEKGEILRSLLEHWTAVPCELRVQELRLLQSMCELSNWKLGDFNQAHSCNAAYMDTRFMWASFL